MRYNYWLNKLLVHDKVIIHPSNHTWVKVVKYWNKYRITDGHKTDMLLDTAPEAITTAIGLLQSK